MIYCNNHKQKNTAKRKRIGNATPLHILFFEAEAEPIYTKKAPNGLNQIPVPNEFYRLAICNKATADKAKRIKLDGQKGVFYKYTFTRARTSITLTIPEADVKRRSIPLQGYRPDFLVASQAAQLLAYTLTLTEWNRKAEGVTIETAVADIIKIIFGEDATPTEREKRTAISRIKDGLTTLQWVNFKSKKVECHGYGNWQENSRGIIIIQLAPDFTRLLIESHQAPFFPQLQRLKSRDDLTYKLIQVLQWRTSKKRRTLSIETVSKWLILPLDGTLRDVWKQRARLESALDELTRLGIVTAWKYTEPRKTTEIPRQSINTQEWLKLALRWMQTEGVEKS